MGRRLAPGDMAMVRRIVSQAAEAEYTLPAFVRGIVHSPAFRMKAADLTPPTTVAPAPR